MRIAHGSMVALFFLSFACGPTSGGQPGGSGGSGGGAGNGGGGGSPQCGADEFSCDAMRAPDADCTANEFGHCDGGVDALPPPPQLCQDMNVNNEPEILVGYSPANGQTVSQNGQIKVWVNDECAPTIAPNEQVNTMTGAITMPGNRSATAPDGYLYEPALYIAPQTAENGGTPHFPTYIKGQFQNNPTGFPFNCFTPITGATIDPPPPNSMLSEPFTAEFIWDVSSLGLAPGTYQGEFVIHDGDIDRAVGCIVIVIQPVM